MSRQKIYELLAVAFTFAVLLFLIGMRADLVDYNVGIYIACNNCFNYSVLDADLAMFYFATGALLVAGFLRPRLPGRFIHLFVGLLILFYIADVFVYRLFNYRLLISDIALYFVEWEAVWDQFSSGVGGVWKALAIVFATTAMLLLLFLMPAARGRPARVLLFAILATALITDLVLESPPFVNSWATASYFRVNMGTQEGVHYSSEFEAELASLNRPLEDQQASLEGPQSGRNVIFVLVESWSSWHSLEFDGFYDWSPHLDAAARRGMQFTDFHSIGFATINGLVGILAGQNIYSSFLPIFERTPFHSMWGVEKSLPRIFANAGYKTAFLTTGPISLYRKGEWMSELGFRHVEGNEHPFYAEEERYAFKSPSDAALYRRGLEWMQTADSPYLMVLETVTTHQPYTDPVSGERSLEKAMRYADKAFGEFLGALDTSGFFEQGLLVVVSDHRSMTPVPARELEHFGAGALSRVPAFMIAKELTPGSVNERVFSQADLVPTFDWWLSGKTQLKTQDAIMLKTEGKAKCAFHERGDRRGVLQVICPEGHGQIYLAGDETRFVQSTGLDEERKPSLLYTVALERLAGLRRHQGTQRNESKISDE